MSRTPKKEHVETLSMAEPPEVSSADITSRDGIVKGQAKAIANESKELEVGRGLPDLKNADGPKPKPHRTFQVLQDKILTVDGVRTRMHAGKQISTAHYDVPALLRQGLKLQEIKQTEDRDASLAQFGFA